MTRAKSNRKPPTMAQCLADLEFIKAKVQKLRVSWMRQASDKRRPKDPFVHEKNAWSACHWHQRNNHKIIETLGRLDAAAGFFHFVERHECLKSIAARQASKGKGTR